MKEYGFAIYEYKIITIIFTYVIIIIFISDHVIIVYVINEEKKVSLITFKSITRFQKIVYRATLKQCYKEKGKERKKIVIKAHETDKKLWQEEEKKKRV